MGCFERLRSTPQELLVKSLRWLDGNDRRRGRTGAMEKGTSRRVANQSAHRPEMGRVAKRERRLASI
jgi:hypothetical protein